MTEQTLDPTKALERDLTFRNNETALVPNILDTEPKIPLLGQSKKPGHLGFLNFVVQSGAPSGWQATKIVVTRPTLLIPYFAAFPQTPNQFTDWVMSAFPEDPSSKVLYNLGSNGNGFQQNRGFYLWTPGVWWITVAAVNAVAGRNLAFLQIPLEDPRAVDLLFNQAAAQSSFQIPVGVATVEELAHSAQVMRWLYVRIHNTGANPVRLVWGTNTAPSGTDGILLNAGEFQELEGHQIPMADLRSFSTLGTELELITSIRGW